MRLCTSVSSNKLNVTSHLLFLPSSTHRSPLASSQLYTSPAWLLPSERHEGQRAQHLLEAQGAFQLEAEVDAREERQPLGGLDLRRQQLLEASPFRVGQAHELRESRLRGWAEAQEGREHVAVAAAHLGSRKSSGEGHSIYL